VSGIYRLLWEELVIIATTLFIPTILRLLHIKPFNSKQRTLRFIFRWLLGIGVTVGIFSIFNSPNQYIGFIQLVLGIGLYSMITFRRLQSEHSGNYWFECQECSFTPSPECPGYSPFYMAKKSAKKVEVEYPEN